MTTSQSKALAAALASLVAQASLPAAARRSLQHHSHVGPGIKETPSGNGLFRALVGLFTPQLHLYLPLSSGISSLMCPIPTEL